MLNLLRKDFIVLKSSLWISVVYLIVFSAAFIPSMDASLQFVGIYTAFATISLGTAIDIKNRNHHFLVTLPIGRKHIVRAKYIAAIIYTLYGVLASFGVHLLAKLIVPELHKPEYSYLDLLIPILIVLLLASFYMPLFYALSEKGTAIINIAFMIILIVLSQPTAYYINMAIEKDIISKQILFLVPFGILLLFIASYFIASKLFVRKDL